MPEIRVFKSKLLKFALVAVAVLVVLVAAAPWLASGFVARSISDAIAPEVNGRVEVGSVSLGWFGPQDVEGIRVDGGRDVGSVEIDASIEQGLWALATGDEVAARVRGRVETEVGADGALGIMRLRRPTAERAVASSAAAGRGEGSAGEPLGGRRVRIEIDGIDLVAAAPDAQGKPVRYEVQGLKGSVELAPDAATRALAIRTELSAQTVAPSGSGRVACDADASIPQRSDGSLDALGVTGTLKLEAAGLPIPSKAGEVLVEKLLVDATLSTGLSADLKVDGLARVAGADASEAKIDLSTGAMRDAAGAFAFDPAVARGSVDLRALPMAAFAPFVPEIAPGVRIDLVEDVGPSADVVVVKRAGEAIRLAVDARRLRLEFDGQVATDGSRIGGGALRASASVRAELLRALGVEAATPLAATLVGKDVAWRAAREDPILPLAGVFDLELAGPFELRVAALEDSVRIESLAASIEKGADQPEAGVRIRTEGRVGAEGDASLVAGGIVRLRGGALRDASADADVVIDPALLARLASNAVQSRGERATARISAKDLSFDPGAAEPRSTLRGSLRVETGGALVVAAGDVESAVSGLVVAASLPDGEAPGSIEVGARIDGAQTRIVQRFDRLPETFTDPAALGLSGSIELRGIEPALVERFAPAAARWTGLLGRGPIELSARNRTEAGAVAVDVRLDAAALDAAGALRLTSDAVAIRDLGLSATLAAEGLASLPLPEDLVIEPGAAISIRVPALALSRGEGGWSPSGDVEASFEAAAIRARRAPKVVGPLEIARLAGVARYSFRDEHAALEGTSAIGGPGAKLADATWSIEWKRGPERAASDERIFKGLSGSIALRDLDAAGVIGRLDPELLGASRATLVEMLAGRGELAARFREDDAATSVVTLDFPRASASLDLGVSELAGAAAARVARVHGSARAEFPAAIAARLAGLADDPSRRIVTPVTVGLEVERLTLPLGVAKDGGSAFAPDLASASLDLEGTLSPLEIEVTSDGARSTVATGAIAFEVESERFADEVVVRLATDRAAARDPAAAAGGARDSRAVSAGSNSSEGARRAPGSNSTTVSTAAAGSIDAQIRARGLLAKDAATPAAPSVDARVTAERFPAAAIDAIAGTDGAVRRYLGDAVDAEFRAAGLSREGGSLEARLASEFASLEAPALTVAEGALRVLPERPIRATLALSPAVRGELLASVHPIFADVQSGKPATFTVDRLSWPLDGDRRRFDARFELTTGEVRLVNSGILSFLLSMAGAERTEGFDAMLEPLRGTIDKGRLTYRDFALRAGRTREGTWKNSLVFSGDVDLAAKPIRANSIVTAVPLSDASNWSRDAKAVFDSIGAASPELLKSLVVGVEFYGPLFDAAGRAVRPESRIKLPDVGEAIRNNPGAIIDAAGSIFDAIRNRNKK